MWKTNLFPISYTANTNENFFTFLTMFIVTRPVNFPAGGLQSFSELEVHGRETGIPRTVAQSLFKPRVYTACTPLHPADNVVRKLSGS